MIIYSDDKFENGEGVQPTFRAINSCLRPLVAMHNMEVSLQDNQYAYFVAC